jgi:hypothetical protein
MDWAIGPSQRPERPQIQWRTTCKQWRLYAAGITALSQWAQRTRVSPTEVGDHRPVQGFHAGYTGS